MADVWRIANWERIYENNRSREIRNPQWVPIPNRHDGAAYAELLDHEHGENHLAAWYACVQVASRCDPRGTLVRGSRRPHTARSLGLVTRISEQTFAEALPRFEALGWIERIPFDSNNPAPSRGNPAPSRGDPAEGCALKGREGKGREGNSTRAQGARRKTIFRKGQRRAALDSEPPEGGTDAD